MMEKTYFRNALRCDIAVENVITVHYFRYARDFLGPGESHDFYELVYIDSGRVEITDGSKTCCLHQGEAFLHRPDVYHNIRALNVLSNIIIVTFDCAGIEGFPLFEKILSFADKEKRLLGEIVEECKDAFIEPLDIVELYKMTQKNDVPFASLQLIKANIEKLLIYLCRLNSFPAPKNTASRQDAVAEKIKAFLADNTDVELTLAKVAAHCGYSAAYIKKLFRRVEHTGILQYFLLLKIERAKKLLAEFRMSCSEIADALAFSSPQHFSTAFKKATNMTPSAYQNSVKISKLLK